MARLSNHPDVADRKAEYEEEDYVHLVMELCAGGELFHHLEKHGRFMDREAALLFRELMEVVMYCHDNGIVHRGIKLENILLVTKSSSSPIKLAEFGLATYIKPGQSLCGTVGSPFYTGFYNQAAGVWSVGVILYILLSGILPFWGKMKSRIFDAVRSLELRFPSDSWDGLSESAKHLISGMLCRNPLQRLTAKQVLEHSWIKEYTQQIQSIINHQTILTFGEDDFRSCSFSTFSNPITQRSHELSFSFRPAEDSDTGASSSLLQADTTTGFSFPLLPSFSKRLQLW